MTEPIVDEVKQITYIFYLK